MITPSRTPAIDLPCSAGRLLRAARVLTRHYDDALRPVGITITQFGLLKVIQRLEPESISDIAQALDIDPSGRRPRIVSRKCWAMQSFRTSMAPCQ